MQKFFIGKVCFVFAILGVSYFLMMDVPTAREFNNKMKEVPKYVPYFDKYNDYIQENFQYIRTLMATILCSGVAILMLPSPLVCTINIILLIMMAVVYYSRNFFENPVYSYAPNIFKFIGVIGGFFLLMGEPAFEDDSKQRKYEEKLIRKQKKKEYFEQLKKKQEQEGIVVGEGEQIDFSNEKFEKQE